MGPSATRLRGILFFYVFLENCLLGAFAQQLPVGSAYVQPRIVQALDENQLTVLKGNTHVLARPEFDRGVAPPDLPMERMLLVLKRSPEQETALRKLLDDQQDKASLNYHKWLAPEQFGKQFGPADQDMQVVTSWLQSHGFRIGNVAKGRNIIEFSGTASQVEEALHTSIHKYVVKGKDHWANASDPKIPTALTPVVAGVHTLHNFLKQPNVHVAEERIAAKLEGNPPHVTFPTNPPLHALAPADYATIYNINPLYQNNIDGSGYAIAVVARSNLFNQGQDINNFFALVGNHGNVTILIHGPDPGYLGGGEGIEATLDATWSGAIGRFANIIFVASASTNTTDGVDLSELSIIDSNSGDVMTESFGGCEAARTSTEAQGIATLAEQAAAQGITYLVSTGDAGAEGCDSPNFETIATGPVSANVLATTPFTVAVGGTMFNENGQDSKYWSSTNGQGFLSALSYIPEDVWNQSCTVAQCGQDANIAAGGGGSSIFFSKPAWQSGVRGIPNDNARDIPDVSLTAAGHDPYLLCFEGSCVPDSQGNIFFAAVSGTSASTPSFAGIMTLVDEKMNSRQGQADYVLYKLAAAENLTQCNASNTSGLPSSTCIFNDVTVGNNAVPGEVGYGTPTAQYQSTVGFDLATGLGSVNVTNLVNKWNTITFKPTITTLSLNPTTIVHGQSVQTNIQVTGNSGTPKGSVSLLGYQGRGITAVKLDTTGAFAGPINSFPGGFYSVTAKYGGDGNFAPSASASSPFLTVTAEPSITTLSVLGYPSQSGVFPPFNSGPYGTFVYLRSDVQGQSGFGTATGSINFMDGAANVPGNPYNLNSQGNTVTPNGLFTFAAGSHSIVANYNGDFSFNASNSTPVPFTITPAPTTSTVTAQGTALTATVATTSGGNPPNGNVVFFVDGAQVGSPVHVTGHSAQINPQSDLVTVPASSTASITAPKAPTKSFQAVYNADNTDTNYLKSTSSATADFTLSASATTVTVASPGTSANVSLNVLSLDGLPGAITFGAASCSGLPTEATCSFNPSTITNSGTTTLTIATKAATAAALRRENHRGSGLWMAASSLGFAGIVLLGVPSRRRWRGALLTCALCVAALAVSCGGGSSSSSKPPPDPGTPAGSFAVVVTATGVKTHSVNFTLTVN